MSGGPTARGDEGREPAELTLLVGLLLSVLLGGEGKVIAASIVGKPGESGSIVSFGTIRDAPTAILLGLALRGDVGDSVGGVDIWGEADSPRLCSLTENTGDSSGLSTRSSGKLCACKCAVHGGVTAERILKLAISTPGGTLGPGVVSVLILGPPPPLGSSVWRNERALSCKRFGTGAAVVRGLMDTMPVFLSWSCSSSFVSLSAFARR